MTEVVMEVWAEGWQRVGSVSEAEPPGSFSSDERTGRQVYIFGCYQGSFGVWRSHGGIDETIPAIRAIHTTGFDQMADLTQGPYEMNKGGPNGPRRIRFSLADT